MENYYFIKVNGNFRREKVVADSVIEAKKILINRIYSRENSNTSPTIDILQVDQHVYNVCCPGNGFDPSGLFNIILCPGRGMGRRNVGRPVNGEKIYNRKVTINNGYDKGGVYWGVGAKLRVKYNRSLTYIEFYRI